MASAATSSLPDPLEPDLAELLEFWMDLKRGENPMPFSDDIDLSRLPSLSQRILLLTVFDDPHRFRFETAGEAIVQDYGSPLVGQFSDDVQQSGPLEGFTEQCLMTVSERVPTYSRLESGSHARLLLPTWGEGHVHFLLGAITKGS